MTRRNPTHFFNLGSWHLIVLSLSCWMLCPLILLANYNIPTTYRPSTGFTTRILHHHHRPLAPFGTRVTT
jgi:hypothetical protein